MKTCLSLVALCSLLFGHFSAHAQREFYTTSTYSTGPGNSSQEGKLVKLDSTGMFPAVKHQFNLPEGRFPYGSVIQAANGKLYGLATQGGQADEGVLFEYDLAIDSFVVKQHLGVTFTITNAGAFGLFEASNGKLYYVSGTNYLMEYDIPSNTLTQRHFFNSPQIPSGHFTEINGKLYGVINFGGPMGYRGYIYEYNTANQTVTYKLNFHLSQGTAPTERPVYFPGNGLLYGTVRFKPNTSSLSQSQGGIYSFNPANNAYAYKMDIPDSIGYGACLTVAPNGKIYGLSVEGGTDANGGHYGCIFEYTPATNGIRTVHNFGMQADGSFTGAGYTVGGMTLASDGKMYGVTATHAFRFDYQTDEVTRLVDLGTQNNLMGIWYNHNGFLQEVCRKPSYTYFDTMEVTLCPGDTFSYTVHSDNAETFSWKKNGSPLATQTDSTLQLTTITVADSGTYTCFMTNLCGNTETMGAIHLTVNEQGAVAPVISAAGSTALCEGESLQITGNTGGTWNVGGTSPTLDVDTSGTYYVISGSAACGTDTSNSITVTVTPLPVINGQPADMAVEEGDAATFTVGAQGTNLGYQWQVNQNQGAGFVNLSNTAPYSGVTTSSLFINYPPLSYHGYLYRCIISAEACSDTSDEAELSVLEPSGIAEEAMGSLVVYPNPATDMLYVKPILGTSIQNMTVRNMLGQVVYTSFANQSQIQVGTFAKGVYTLELITDQGTYLGRFVKN